MSDEVPVSRWHALEQLLGHDWLQGVLNDQVRNPAVSFWRDLWTADEQAWVEYARLLDGAAAEVLAFFDDQQRQRLAVKLRTNPFDHVAELWWGAVCHAAGFAVEPEPTFPQRGPDFRITIEEESAFLEVATLHHEQENERCMQDGHRIARALRKCGLPYVMNVDVARPVDGHVVRIVAGRVRGALADADSDIRPFPFRLFFDQLGQPGELDARGRRPADEEADAVAPLHWETRFAVHVFASGEKADGLNEPVTCIGRYTRFIDAGARVRRLIADKRDQLRPDAANILVMDLSVSDQRFQNVETGLFGRLGLTMKRDASGRTVAAYPSRDSSGSVGRSGRISAAIASHLRVRPKRLFGPEHEVQRDCLVWPVEEPMARHPLSRAFLGRLEFAGSTVVPGRPHGPPGP